MGVERRGVAAGEGGDQRGTSGPVWSGPLGFVAGLGEVLALN
jgi:hypothetical protein